MPALSHRSPRHIGDRLYPAHPRAPQAAGDRPPCLRSATAAQLIVILPVVASLYSSMNVTSSIALMSLILASTALLGRSSTPIAITAAWPGPVRATVM